VDPRQAPQNNANETIMLPVLNSNWQRQNQCSMHS